MAQALTALTPSQSHAPAALRQLPKLEYLPLNNNQITDQGLASLLAPLTAGVLPSLEQLHIDRATRSDEITDEACTSVTNGRLCPVQTPKPREV